MSVQEFLGQNSIGVLLRTYAPRPELVEPNAERLKRTVQHLCELTLFGEPVIERIGILVWGDPRFRNPDGSRMADCGDTWSLLQDVFWNEKRVFVHNVPIGDIYCTILNEGVMRQHADYITHSIILSTEAKSNLTDQVLLSMVNAAADGAKVVAVALKEVADLVRRGIVCNTCCMWELESLIQVGLFRMEDCKPWRPGLPFASLVKGVDIYDAGVGELLPAALISALYGRAVIAVVEPPEEAGYDLSADPKRNEEKFQTKLLRVQNMMERTGLTWEQIEAGVIRL
jgi:hypothetical protein